LQDLLSTAPEWLRPVLLGVAAILIALLAHWGLMFALRRTASHTQTATDDIVIARLASPARYLMVILALSAVQPTMDLPPSLDEFWSRIVGLAMPALFGWLAIAVLGIVKDLVEANADISVADNLRARRRRTQATLLYRIALFLVLLITFCMMLITFPGVRAVGVTLLASAGLTDGLHRTDPDR
jgi:small-conductance mechanosensitive channel